MNEASDTLLAEAAQYAIYITDESRTKAVGLRYDGSVEFRGVMPDEASRLFWDSMGREMIVRAAEFARAAVPAVPLRDALQRIADMDPDGKRADDLGRAARIARSAIAGVPASSEPIPPRAYWAPLADNFYNAEGYGLGLDFYRKWRPRRSEFPQGEAAGWGPNSAHNPFKDAPRNAGVKGPDHG